MILNKYKLLQLLSRIIEEKDNNSELCGHLVIKDDILDIDFRENYYTDLDSVRPYCQLEKSSCMKFHTHPCNDKHYPSGEDLASIICGNDNKLEIIVTISGIWEIYKKEKYRYNNEKNINKCIIESLKLFGDNLYFDLNYHINKDSRFIKVEDIEYINKYINVIKSIYNVEIYFTSIVSIIDNEFNYEVISDIEELNICENKNDYSRKLNINDKEYEENYINVINYIYEILEKH